MRVMVASGAGFTMVSAMTEASTRAERKKVISNGCRLSAKTFASAYPRA
jgi:hypothetical protein